MGARSRRFVVESLEARRPLSTSLATVSILATSAPVHATGTIAGSVYLVEGHPSATVYAGSGQLGKLGDIQVKATFPIGRNPRGTVTFTSTEGTLNFAANWKNSGPIQLMTEQGTGGYANWTGHGTLKIGTTAGGYRHMFPVELTFNLSLKA